MSDNPRNVTNMTRKDWETLEHPLLDILLDVITEDGDISMVPSMFAEPDWRPRFAASVDPNEMRVLHRAMNVQRKYKSAHEAFMRFTMD